MRLNGIVCVRVGVRLLGHLFRELISSCPGLQPGSDGLWRASRGPMLGAAVRLRGPNASMLQHRPNCAVLFVLLQLGARLLSLFERA